MTPMTVNAYANFGMVEIVFPAAILQPPFFDPNADPAVNYGGIGAVIGHEISHHFDDQGAKYDANGRLTDWWTPDDVAAFKAPARRARSSNMTPMSRFPGMHVKGELTLGENIADLAGLTVAYDAYRAFARRQGGAGDRRHHRRPALLSRLGAGVAAQLSRGQPAPAAADRSALAVGAARLGRPQPRPLVSAPSTSQPGQKLYLAPDRAGPYLVRSAPPAARLA